MKMRNYRGFLVRESYWREGGFWILLFGTERAALKVVKLSDFDVESCQVE
jgi:hypothetical protein